MDLTTLARVKTLMGKDTTAEDAAIDQTIAGVSRAAETFMRREAEIVARTEIHSAYCGQRSILLRAWGAPTLSVSSLWNDVDRTFATTDVLPSTDYFVDAKHGRVVMDTPLVQGIGSVKVVYTGGMGVNVSDMIANGFEDIVHAVETQVVFMLKRRANPEVAAVTDPGGNVSFAQQIDFLPYVRKALKEHRRKQGAI